MGSFTDESMTKKLSELNCSQQAIETMSAWLRHYHKHVQRIVEIWLREFIKERRPTKLLTLLYVANDVIQLSRKKHAVFVEMFAKNRTLSKAIEHLAKHIASDDQKTAFAVKKVLIVWKDREVYSVEVIYQLMHSLTSNLQWTYSQIRSLTTDLAATPPHEGSSNKVAKKRRSSMGRTGKSPISPKTPASGSSTPGPSFMDTSAHRVKVEEKEPTPSIVAAAPTTLQLLEALQQLNGAASEDANTREQIASFPEDVANTGHLKSITNEDEASILYANVKKAEPFVTQYCERLSEEMVHRKQTQEMLVAYLEAQKLKARESQTLLSKFQEKMERLSKEREEVMSHYQALPDLSQLAGLDVNGMAPLPSAGELFNKYMPPSKPKVDFGEDEEED